MSSPTPGRADATPRSRFPRAARPSMTPTTRRYRRTTRRESLRLRTCSSTSSPLETNGATGRSVTVFCSEGHVAIPSGPHAVPTAPAAF